MVGDVLLLMIARDLEKIGGAATYISERWIDRQKWRCQTHHVYIGFLAYCLAEVKENKNLRTRKNEPGYVIRFATSTGLACQCIDRGAEVIVDATS